MDGEQVWQWEEDWRDLWPRGAGWHDVVMNESERDALAGLPDPVLIFRGYSHGPGARGLSWTTDRVKAEWFARRFAVVDGAMAFVAVGTVLKALVIAYLLERGESEVLAWPEHVAVTGVEVIDEQEEGS